MSKLNELTDFSMYEGHIPCILCKEESSPTLVGSHWKCSVCAHVFNQDGSDTKIECHCDGCREEKKAKDAPDKSRLEAVLDNVKKVIKGISKKKK
jgi:hypothetical protein